MSEGIELGEEGFEGDDPCVTAEGAALGEAVGGREWGGKEAVNSYFGGAAGH